MAKRKDPQRIESAMFPSATVLQKVAQIVAASECELAREADVKAWLDACREINWIKE